MLATLAPLSALYGVVGRVRKSLYDNDKLAKYHAPIPVMIIGNITVGGSGKTPLIIALVKYLQGKGINVGVISRGYGRVDSSPALVREGSTPKKSAMSRALSSKAQTCQWRWGQIVVGRLRFCLKITQTYNSSSVMMDCNTTPYTEM